MKQSLPNTIHLVDVAIERLMDELMVQLVDAPDSPENRVNAILQVDKARCTMRRAIHNAALRVERLNNGHFEWSGS